MSDTSPDDMITSPDDLITSPGRNVDLELGFVLLVHCLLNACEHLLGTVDRRGVGTRLQPPDVALEFCQLGVRSEEGSVSGRANHLLHSGRGSVEICPPASRWRRARTRSWVVAGSVGERAWSETGGGLRRNFKKPLFSVSWYTGNLVT